MPHAQYKCSLDDLTTAKARDELGETEDLRQRELAEFYDWVMSQDHLICPTDPNFLLRYLRASKFDQLKAQERLTNHLGLLSQRRKWFGNVDPLDTEVQAVLDEQHVLYLPGTDGEGQKVILYRLGSFDPDSTLYDKAGIIRCFTALFLHQIHNENIQVNGFVYLLDASTFTMRQQLFWNVKDLMLIAKLWQNAMPCRFKAFHFYNIGIVFEVLFRLLMPFLSSKFRERIFVHRKLETVYEHVPKHLLPMEYLPDDYCGPNAGTLDELTEKTKVAIAEPEVRKRLMYETGEGMGIKSSLI